MNHAKEFFNATICKGRTLWRWARFAYMAVVSVRTVSILLMLSFVLVPLQPVFGQVSDTNTTPVAAPSETPEAQITVPEESGVVPSGTSENPAGIPSPPESILEEPPAAAETENQPGLIEEPKPLISDESPEESLQEEELAKGEDEQMSLLSGDDDQPPTVAHPTFTYKSIEPKIDKATGALTQTLRLAIPPGRNGMEPDLALTYNSQNLEDSIVGYGWNINIPYIERINRMGTNNMYSLDYFTSSISGELASTTTFGEYAAKVEDGDFLKYTFATTSTTSSWVVHDKQGTRYTFGVADASKQFNTGSTTEVYKWMLEEVRDTNDNFIRYEYYKEGGQLYPSKIYYTGSGATDGVFTVEFNRESRPDVVTSYKTAFLATTSYRISEIVAKVNSTWVRKYELDYTAGNNSSRSLLSSVTESGQQESGSGSLTLPPISFAYTSELPAYASGSPFGPVDIKNAARALADVNGDGQTDVTLHAYNPSTQTVSGNVTLNYGNGVTEATGGTFFPEYWGTTNGSAWSPSPTEAGTRLFDVNGDGLADLVSSTSSLIRWNYYQPGPTFSWELSTTTATSSVPSFVYGTVPGTTAGLLGNLNGDGLTDFVQSLSNTATYNGGYLGNGNGFAAATSTFAAPFYLPTSAPDLVANQLVDINGDGLDDWTYNDSGSIKFRLNNGAGWNGSEDSRWTLSTTTVNSEGLDQGIRFFDINGDNLPDFVRSYYVPYYSGTVGGGHPEIADIRMVKLNTGSGWATSTIELPSGISDRITYECAGSLCNKEMWNWSGDAGKMDMLKTITYATGGSTDVSYTPTTRQLTSANRPMHTNLPFPVWTVGQLTHNDGKGNLKNAYYRYENGDLYFNNPYDRKFAGFETITENVGDTLVRTYYHQGNVASTTVGEMSDDVSKTGKAYREDVMASSTGALYKRAFYGWDTADLGNGRDFVFLATSSEQTYDGDSDHRDKGANYVYSTTTGNLLQKIDWGEVTGSSDGTFTDTGTDKASTTISYAASSTSGMSLPSQETTVDYSLATLKESKYYYDSLAHGSTTKGNLTKREDWKASSSYASTTKAYNTYGLVASSTDARGKTTSYVYDSNNLYPASTTNALSQVTSRTYDYSSGKVKQLVDPNTRTFESTYDPLDRIIGEVKPDPTTGVAASTTAYTYTDTPNNKSVRTQKYLNASTSTDAYTYFDGLERKVQERMSSETSNVFAVRDFSYDNRGLLGSETAPYFSTGTGSTTATSTTALYTLHLYDILSRPAYTSTAVGHTAYTYDDWKTTITDANGNSKDLTNDADGNLASVVEYLDGAGYTTAYIWDKLGRLTKLTDALGNVRNFTYDGLGRRTSAEDLHTVGDSQFGTWTYTYDDAGNVTQTVNPNAQTVNYTYDNLNRPLTEDLAGSGDADPEIAYWYDSCADGIGRLCVATSTGTTMVVSKYTYNPVGGVASEERTVDLDPYTTTYSYDRQGNVTDMVYPDNSEVHYTYNTAGLVEKVEQKEEGGSFAPVVSNMDYAPAGAITATYNANGVITTNSYDADNLYRLKRKETCAGACTSARESVQVLIIGGGGGGGSAYNGNEFTNSLGGGGGGAGGMKEQTLELELGVHTIVVGAGGSGGTGCSNGQNGAGSSIGIALSVVGGGGGGRGANNGCDPLSGAMGSSGGGGGGGTGAPVGAGGTPGQGTAGGRGNTSKLGGGGGGKGGPGGTVTAGAGLASTITGSSVTYAAGGLGGDANEGESNGADGTAHTGNGGEGAQWSGTNGSRNGGAGGSGVVIIRYPTAKAAYFTCGGSTSTTGSDTLCTYAASSSPQTFTVSSTTNVESSHMQDLAYVYDPVGNIVQNIDTSSTGSYKTMNYTYDDLNRLLVASSSGATSTVNYRYNYSYNALGNILSSPVGTYFYGGTGYANPHAVTSINAITLDAATSSVATGYSATTTVAWNHTTSGTNRLLVLTADLWQNNPGEGTITSATYNGVALTKATGTRAGGIATEIWYLVNPASGTHSVSVEIGGETLARKLATASFTGIAQTSPLQATSTNTGFGGTPSGSITAGTANGLIVSTLSRFGTTDATTTQIAFFNDSVTSTLGAASYQVATATGSYSDTYTGAASADWSMALAAFKPATSTVVTSADTLALAATSSNSDATFSTGTTTTWTHTTSGSNRLLVLTADIFQNVAGTGSISSATYNGVALTPASTTRSGGIASEIWYLANPTSGSNTLSVTVTGTTLARKYGVASFTGADQTAPLDALGSNTGYNVNPSATTTTGVANAVIVSTLSRFGTTTATTNRTSIFNNSASSILGAASYHLAGVAGAYADTYTGAAAADWSMLAASFKPGTIETAGPAVNATTSYAYDNNGNLTTAGTSTYAWDYRNRMTTSFTGVTSTYAYDHTTARIKQTVAGVTTHYPSKYFSAQGLTTTKHIFAEDMLLSTIDTNSGGSETIAFAASSTKIHTGFVGTGTTTTWSHTVSGSNPLIVLSAAIFQDVAGTGSITSATWGGDAFIRASTTRTGTKSAELWYLVATSTGTKTLSVTVTGSTNALKYSAATFTGVSPTSPLDAVNTAAGASGNPSASVTTNTANAVVVTTLHRHSTTAATTNRTSIYNDAVSSVLGAASYQLSTSAGSYSDTYTGSATQNWGMVIAAFKPATTASSRTVHYIHPDHLSSTNIVTNASGTVEQVLDYYPYGSKRLNSGTDVSQREFIGQYGDDSGLSYLNARYYEGSRGQFTSQDPMFWKDTSQQNLQNPQSLNSYSYANGNPIVNKDPQGETAIAIAAAPFVPLGPPGWVIGAGIVIFSSVYLATEFIDRGGLQTGTLQDSRPYDHLLYPSPQNPNDLQPPRNGAPEWQKWLYRALGLGYVGYELHDQYKKHEEGAKSFLQNSNPNNSNQGSAPSYNMPRPYVVQGNTTYVRTSGGGLAPTSLPTTVNDGQGNTYYRNSDGLLSTQPGL